MINFKDQDFEEIRQSCLDEEALFEDPTFPPCDESISPEWGTLTYTTIDNETLHFGVCWLRQDESISLLLQYVKKPSLQVDIV